MAVTFADAERAMKSWINLQTADLVGTGHPLTKGATLDRLRGAQQACYVLVSLVGATRTLGAESPDMLARIGGQVYGPSKEVALTAAVAYAEKITSGLDGHPVLIPGVAVLLMSDNLSGPLWSPDAGEARYLVDFDLYLRPA